MIGRSGNAVANQFIITDEGQGANGNFIKRESFQSYRSVIATRTIWPKEALSLPTMKEIEITLDEYYWNYSRTTSKYRSQFLGETTKETQAKIDSGEYKLANLNQ